MIEDYSRFEVPDSQKRCMKKMEVRLMYKTFEEITNQYESLAKPGNTSPEWGMKLKTSWRIRVTRALFSWGAVQLCGLQIGRGDL